MEAEMDGFRIQLAQATDSLKLAIVHDTCFPGTLVHWLGHRYYADLFHRYADDELGFTLFASKHDEVVGLVAGGNRNIENQFVRSIPKRFPARLAWGALVNSGVRKIVLETLKRRFRRGESHGGLRSSVPVPEGTSWLHILCVLPSSRGTGTAIKLTNAFFNASREAGFTQAQLRVLLNNDRALAFYRKTGWKEVGSTETAATLQRSLEPIS